MFNTIKLINQIRKQYPYNNLMCKDKYNEFIQDLLYDIIISRLWHYDMT